LNDNEIGFLVAKCIFQIILHVGKESTGSFSEKLLSWCGQVFEEIENHNWTVTKQIYEELQIE
jgi:hypothetical protein